MNENDLYLPTWREISDQRRQLIFEQVLRYFINPLWHVANIRPLQMQYRNQTLLTCQADLNGQTFVFVPGNLRANLNGEEVAVSPFLIARTAVNANHYYLGELNVVNGETFGQMKLLREYQSEIDDYLLRTRQKASLNPFATPPTTIQTEHLTFGTTESESVPIYLQEKWSYSDLRQFLRRNGCNLPTRNQWEYAATAGVAKFELPLNQDLHSVIYDQMGYGVAFKQARQWELLDDPELIKQNPLFVETSDERELASALFQQYAATYEPILTENLAYRPVFNVQLD